MDPGLIPLTHLFFIATCRQSSAISTFQNALCYSGHFLCFISNNPPVSLLSQVFHMTHLLFQMKHLLCHMKQLAACPFFIIFLKHALLQSLTDFWQILARFLHYLKGTRSKFAVPTHTGGRSPGSPITCNPSSSTIRYSPTKSSRARRA